MEYEKKLDNDVKEMLGTKERVSGLKEFYKRGRGDALGWGLVFIWGAIVALLEITNVVSGINWWDGWAMFFAGFGILALIGAVIAVIVEENHSKAGWNFFFGFILLGFSLSGLINPNLFGVMILCAIASTILIGALNKKTTSKKMEV